MQNNYKILVVEDETDLRGLLTEILEGEGYSCKSAADGLDAKEMLEIESFDLLITDLQMPRMDGVELLHWCRSSQIHFPVIFISANVHLLPKEEVALEDCCAAVIQKPMDIDTILSAVVDAKKRNHNFNCQLS